MRKAFPERSKLKRPAWTVLENNDPTGFKSSAAKRAKRDIGMSTVDLPRRSPDLNVLDYALWHAINVRMRAQESSWPLDRKETAADFKKRLRKTALSLPQALVTKCVRDMRRRCLALFARRGKLFAE